MGGDGSVSYAWVHVYYTIPPAILLSFFYRPLCTAFDVQKVALLVLIAIVSTTPWDAYLIHRHVWSYPAHGILGPTLFGIPAEEVFFFFIQTYNTSLLYLFLSKPTFHPVYLRAQKENRQLQFRRWFGAAILGLLILVGAKLLIEGGHGTYLGLIFVWAGPFALFLWLVAYQFLLTLPRSNTWWPIIIPTVYLWLVDAAALQRGNWVIEDATKLNFQIFGALDIEEAVFFVYTNVLIVFGLVAYDNALAICQTFPDCAGSNRVIPSFAALWRALLVSPADYNADELDGLRDALTRLRKKSRSFYLASAIFSGRLRQDLILLYSFCRAADDLVDEAADQASARAAITQLQNYLDQAFSPQQDSKALQRTVDALPSATRSALQLLPTAKLSKTPLEDLLKGFVTDLQFASNKFPIADETALDTYSQHVAGTVAESCIELVFTNEDDSTSTPEINYSSKTNPKLTRYQSASPEILKAGRCMGIALQLVNIARDIAVDAAIGRVYIPSTWLSESGLTPSDILANPSRAEIEPLRQRLLDRAFGYYGPAKEAIARLPASARGPMRVAVESYMEIGRTLRQPGYQVKRGRATVPVWRRLVVAWRASRG